MQAVRQRIYEACMSAGRDISAVRLIAVSKTFPADAVREVASAGQTAFGENYVQEAADKMSELNDLALEWHFIGPIQSNKTRLIAERFAWVHSVDRLKIAQRLAEQRPATLPPLNILLQVNLSGEASKSGCSPNELSELARAVGDLPRVRLQGLMTIPEPTDDPSLQRQRFAALKTLRRQLEEEGLRVPELSMGMSADLEAAIMEGATLVRIGKAVFGQRAPSHQTKD